MEGVLPLAATLTLLAGAGIGSGFGAPAAQPAPAAAGVRLVIAELDIALTTPDRWRISMDSTPAELLLEAGSERAPVRLRVRRSAATATPRERMRSIAHELGGAYTTIEYQGEEALKAGEREATLLRAAGDEVTVRLFVTRMAPGAEHLFWLEGGSRDVARAEEEVLALIAEATPAAGASAPGSAGSGAAFRHPTSGLVIERHPPGLAPVSLLPEELDAGGITWRAGEEGAPVAAMSLSRRSVGPIVDETTAAASLGTELRNSPDVAELMSTRDRLAHRPARRLTWLRTGGEQPVAHETWIFKSGSSLFRLDLVTSPSWLKTNAAALEEFRRGLRFEE